MRCSDVKGLLTSRISGEISEADRKLLDGHLETCDSCRQDLQSAQEALNALGSWSDPVVPPGLVERTATALQTERESPRRWSDRFDELLFRLSQLKLTPLRSGLAVAFGLLVFFGYTGLNRSWEVKPAAERTCRENIRVLGKALREYRKAYQGQTPVELSGLVPEYMESLPSCPQAGTDTYSDGYETELGSKSFSVYCSGHHHQDQGLEADKPRYDSAEFGL